MHTKNAHKKITQRLHRGFALLLVLLLLTSCDSALLGLPTSPLISLDSIPEYSGDAYVEINGNEPFFTAEELTTAAFETYSPLDSLGRCGVAYANICTEIMPTEPRGEIGQVKPTGWHTVRYDDLVDGKYLYNRCHLIGYQLAGENANEQNLITGTRYLNVEGMLPFENLVSEYVDETGNHVLYRVTPIFEGENLLADGVLMEAYSVEDNGEGISFCVFCYNVQPGITIDYTTGDSHITTDDSLMEDPAQSVVYILNTNTMKFHLPTCGSVEAIASSNYQESSENREALISAGYSPCGSCKP